MHMLDLQLGSFCCIYTLLHLVSVFELSAAAYCSLPSSLLHLHPSTLVHLTLRIQSAHDSVLWQYSHTFGAHLMLRLHSCLIPA